MSGSTTGMLCRRVPSQIYLEQILTAEGWPEGKNTGMYFVKIGWL
jgi:hypothetical protein